MSKKQKNNEPKPKDFAAAPFQSLKGFQAKTSLPPEKKAPEPPPPVVETEDNLFLREMLGVRRLDGCKPAKKEASVNAVPAAVKIDEEEKRVFLKALKNLQLDVRFAEEVPDGEEPLKPLSANRMRQLKRGDIRIDLELDLHGLTREEALQSLSRFITSAHSRGQKAVLVITGKGNNSPDEPVLLSAVAGWLREKGRNLVAEFSPAPRDMGGAGAFVVFLKDKEKTQERQKS